MHPNHRVGLFNYDPDFAHFGNAISPFMEVSSCERTQLAMQRRPEDRYNPRYDNQPTASEWFEASLGGMSPDDYLNSALESRVGGVFDGVSQKTGLSSKTIGISAFIAGATAFFAMRNPKHVLEIAITGVAGVAFAIGVGSGAR